jgi:hypothetical protein
MSHWNRARPAAGLQWWERKQIVGVAPEADDPQSLGMSVSMPLAARIAGIVYHSLITTVLLFVTSCRSGLHSTKLLMNWQLPLPGAFDFLDCHCSEHLLITWVDSDVCNAEIGPLVGDFWQGLISLIRFEGQGRHAEPGLDSSVGVETYVAVLQLSARSRTGFSHFESFEVSMRWRRWPVSNSAGDRFQQGHWFRDWGKIGPSGSFLNFGEKRPTGVSGTWNLIADCRQA